MNDSKNRKIGAILSYIIIGLNMIVGIFYTPLLTSKLGQSEFGLYQYINSIIGYLSLLDLGLGNAIIIYMSKAIKNKDSDRINKLFSMFLSIFTTIGLLAACIGVVLFLNANLLFSSVTASELATAKILLLILVFNIAISFPSSVFSNAINAHEKFILIKILNIINIIAKPVLIIPLLFLGFKSIALVLVTTLVNFVIITINFIYCKTKLNIKFDFNGWSKKLLKEIFNYSIWIALTEIVDKVNWSVDNFLIGKIMGTVSVSIYAISSQLNQIYIQFSTAISGVMLPKITKINEEKENLKKLNEIWIKTGHIQLILVGFVLSGYIIFGRQFILLWVGKEYQKSYIVGVVLMVPMLFSLIQNVGASITQAKKKHKFMSLIYFVIAILNIFISIPLIYTFGELGAALGTAISLIIGNVIIKNIYWNKFVGLDVIAFFKNIIPLLIGQIVYGSICFLVVSRLHLTNWINLFISILVYCMVYCVVIYCFMNKYEKDLILNIKRKVLR